MKMCPKAESPNLGKSLLLKKRAERVIPAMTQTFSKGPTQYVQGIAPVFLRRGQGSHVWDVDGNEYIDYVLALGPIILGYNYEPVVEAVQRQLRDGSIFSLPHELEIEVAELLVDIIPCAEMVRFGKHGSDVTSAAVRVARAFRGREKIACCGYHGWQDWFIVTTSRPFGVPASLRDYTHTFEYNDIQGLERLFAEYPNEIAAVIMEPVGVVEPEGEFLSKVKDVAHANGALLIFDEIVTGFRLALGGAQQHFGVIPDLACFGKAMANGFPLSALVGRRDIMELFDDVFFSSTFGGETLSLAACKATLTEMRNHEVFDQIWKQGRILQDGYDSVAKNFGLDKRTKCMGLAPHTVMWFSDSDGADGLILRSLFQQEMIRSGILFLSGNNVCLSHSDDDMDRTLSAYRYALTVVSRALENGNPREFLSGEPVQPVFRRP